MNNFFLKVLKIKQVPPFCTCADGFSNFFAALLWRKIEDKVFFGLLL
jgi:hypothetical protein